MRARATAIWVSVKARGRELAAHPAVARLRAAIALVIDRAALELQKRPKRVAVTLSVALHLAVLLLFLVHPPRGFAGGGADGKGWAGGEGVGVSLIGSDDFEREAMTAKAQPDEPEEVTPLELAATTDGLLTTKVEALPQVLSDALPDALKDQEAAHAAMGAPGSGRSGQNGTSGDDLWGAIAPCWRRVADANTLPVTLEMSFDAQGRLSVPPTIDRDPGVVIDTRSLQSEAKALQALSACGAYAMAAGRENVKVNFPRP